MNTMSYAAFRKELAKTLDRVNDNHLPVMITRQNGKAAVVMSVEDYRSYQETAYLMASPKNAARLNEAVREIEEDKAVEHELSSL
ncbi:type II toxin-antitoxin system prevent-host-death family antitoxin [Myxococcota bacterium]|nr:type II toxin-antitoxin system prevent-host-death family antitoxin [Myxococcota bacterium]